MRVAGVQQRGDHEPIGTRDPGQRIDEPALAGALIESLDETIDEGAEALWVEEIGRRQRELDQGQVRTIPWSQARRAIQGG
ncbi:MAG TPA: addiction module protein [Planctomycetota bacterium]